MGRFRSFLEYCKPVAGDSWSKLDRVPLMIYQHIPKCGGRSFIAACKQWFGEVVVDDPPPYPARDDIDRFQQGPLDLSLYPDRTFLHGHLIYNGIRPMERYGRQIVSGQCRLITVIRDPLERAISAYFHRIRKGRPWHGPLETWLLHKKNSMCRFLGIEMREGCPTDDRFFFIGVTEQLQESMDVFAKLIGVRRLRVPHINVSPRQEYALSTDLLTRFRRRNAMDYALYAYACHRLYDTQRAIRWWRTPRIKKSAELTMPVSLLETESLSYKK